MVSRNHKSLVVITFGLCLGISACSDNSAVGIRYEAEKKYYAAEQALKDVRSEGGQLQVNGFAEVYIFFRDANDFCYAGLETIDQTTHPVEFNELRYLTVRSSLKLAQLFYTARKFDSAQTTLNRLLKEVQLSQKQRLPIYLYMGKTLQASGNFDSALVVFDFVIQDYYPPIDNGGEIVMGAFTLPTQIYHSLRTIGDSAAAAGRFKSAEMYYRRLLDDHPKTRLAAAARTRLANLYDETGQWHKELSELNALTDSSQSGYEEIMVRIADILGGRLGEYDTAMAIYENLSAHLKPSDTGLGPILVFKMALVRIDQRQYAQAREFINRLKREFPVFYATDPMPQYTLARSYDREGNWPVAEQEYSLLIEKYHGTDEAMMSLLYLFDILRDQGRPDEADLWYQKAEGYFNEVALAGFGTPVEAKALFYKAELYRRNNQPELVAEVLLSIFGKFPGSEPGSQAAVAAAKLYRENLGNPQKADSLLVALRQQPAKTGQVVPVEDLFAD